MVEKVICSIDGHSTPSLWHENVLKLNAKPSTNPLPDGAMVYDRKTGEYFGIKGAKAGNTVYVADKVESKNIEKGMVQTIFTNWEKLNLSHSEFQVWASTVYAESSLSMCKEIVVAREMGAIAYVHLNNNPKAVAFGKTSKNAKTFMSTIPKRRTGLMQIANWAVINASLKGNDYSNGAKFWDGQEQSLYSETETSKSVKYTNSKGKVLSFELHMNTIGWRISDEHYKEWKENVGSKFKAPQVRFATVGVNKGKIKYQSTAVHCKTIFWKEV